MRPIALIGMSNIGKSDAARRLVLQGYTHIDCDALIEQKLGTLLTGQGFKGITDIAAWMGQPPDARYAANSARYTACEEEVMRETLASLPSSGPAVIDTTGSVIYAAPDVLNDLRARSLVVHLEASPRHVEDMYRRYIDHPKPVIWGDAYAPLPGEDPITTLRRCYPDLLQRRARLYHELAHITIPYVTHRARTVDFTQLTHPHL